MNRTSGREWEERKIREMVDEWKEIKMWGATRAKQGSSGARVAFGHAAIGATSLGVLAVGATAVGAVAVDALAIRVLAVRRGKIGSLDIEDLEVGRLRVRTLVVEHEQAPLQAAPTTPR